MILIKVRLLLDGNSADFTIRQEMVNLLETQLTEIVTHQPDKAVMRLITEEGLIYFPAGRVVGWVLSENQEPERLPAFKSLKPKPK